MNIIPTIITYRDIRIFRIYHSQGVEETQNDTTTQQQQLVVAVRRFLRHRVPFFQWWFGFPVLVVCIKTMEVVCMLFTRTDVGEVDSGLHVYFPSSSVFLVVVAVFYRQ